MHTHTYKHKGNLKVLFIRFICTKTKENFYRSGKLTASKYIGHFEAHFFRFAYDKTRGRGTEYK